MLNNNPVFYNLAVKDKIETYTKILFYALFQGEEMQAQSLKKAKHLFCEILDDCSIPCEKQVWNTFQKQIKGIRTLVDLDAQAALNIDPAAKSLQEVYLAYPGFHAIAIYRLSRALWLLDVPIVPRMMSEYAHSITGTDIHPGASIGQSFFIDHATGIVIGETSVIKDHVKIYQGVTLGGIQVKKELDSIKRHPTIEDHVTIYANATILGGNIVIGKHSVIGANVWITQSIEPYSLVTYKSEIQIKTQHETATNHT